MTEREHHTRVAARLHRWALNGTWKRLQAATVRRSVVRRAYCPPPIMTNCSRVAP